MYIDGRITDLYSDERAYNPGTPPYNFSEPYQSDIAIAE